MYTKLVRQQRKQVAQLTLNQQHQLHNLYNNSINNLSKRIKKDGNKSLTQRWLKDYTKQLIQVRDNLEKTLNSQITKSIKDGAKIGTSAEQKMMGDIFKKAKLTVSDSFNDMFSQVQDSIVKDIISGELYKDKRTLSARIWNYGKDFEKDIQYVINQAILEKKSAIELAKDLEKYVKDPAKRTIDWGKCYPRLKTKKVDYNAMRLARTSINHSYQTATIQSSQMNPFIEGIKWLSAFAHGRTCDLCIERATTDQYGLGVGIFPKDDVPLDHPNGLCTMAPHIEKTTMEVARELRWWLEGDENPMLDDWYKEYTGLFSKKDIKTIAGVKTIDQATQKTKEIVKDKLLDKKEFKKLDKDKYKDVVEKEINAYYFGDYKEALESYIGSTTSWDINRYLYSGGYEEDIKNNNVDGWNYKSYAKHIENLSEIISKNTLPENLKLTRFTGFGEVGSIFKQLDIDVKMPNRMEFEQMSQEDINSLVGVMNKKLTGLQYKNKGFVSTSFDEDSSLFRGKLAKISILAEEGQEGLITKNWIEAEVILNKDSIFQIDEVNLVKSYTGLNQIEMVVRKIEGGGLK